MKQKTKRGSLGMLLDTLSAGLLGNLLTGKGTIRADEGKASIFNGASSFNKF